LRKKGTNFGFYRMGLRWQIFVTTTDSSTMHAFFFLCRYINELHLRRLRYLLQGFKSSNMPYSVHYKILPWFPIC
jgi:hypothetical protein